MAWRYPLYMIQEGYVVDNIAINENLLSITEETSGYLNEHNFEAKDVDYITRSNLKAGAAMKLAYTQGESVAANAPYSRVEGSPPPFYPGDANFGHDWTSVRTPNVVAVASVDTYQTFEEPGLTLTFTSRGGPTLSLIHI